MAQYSGSVRPFRAPQRHAPAKPPRRRPLDRRQRLRAAGCAVLVAGVLCAGLLGWQRIYHSTPTIEELLPASAKAHRRQMGILYGTVGSMAVDLEAGVQRPDVQIALVLAASAIGAGLCFRLARFHDDDAFH